MEKPNRRIVWMHVTFCAIGDIKITFTVERWKGGKYIGKRCRTCTVTRLEWVRLGDMVKLARYHADARHILPAYNGWSCCFETLFS